MITICPHEEIKRKIAHILAAIYLIKNRKYFFLIGKQETYDPYALKSLFIPEKIGYEIRVTELYQGGKVKRKLFETKTVFCDEQDIITVLIETVVCQNSHLFGERELVIPKANIEFSLLKRIIKRIKEPDSLYFDSEKLKLYGDILDEENT